MRERGQKILTLREGNDNRLRLWDLSTGMNTLVNYPNALNRTPKSNQFAVSNNGKFVYYPSFNSINVYLYSILFYLYLLV
jgi:DNA excision repair protein ERCC-8